MEYYVALVNGEPDVRLLLDHLFESAGIRFRCYGSAESLLQDEGKVQFGCIVLDIGLTGISGLDLLSDLRQRRTNIPIVLISGQATVSDAVRAFRERVSEFFEKPFNNQELVATVRELMSNWAAQQARQQDLASKLAELSPRQKEVLDALMAGKKTTQIARELAISASTVEKHRLRIFEKTGVDSTIGLVHLFSSPSLASQTA
jgi:FixJ family two-component response regulator